jgi:hypothetical protein
VCGKNWLLIATTGDVVVTTFHVRECCIRALSSGQFITVGTGGVAGIVA